MVEIIAGVEIPGTSVVAEATEVAKAMTSSLLFHHSRRVFLFGALRAQALGLSPDPELLYVAALFHDSGMLTPFSAVVQRFEIDGADHAQSFLRDRGFPASAVEVVWNAIALHTTPEIPSRMGAEIAATSLGVATDVLGFGLPDLDPSLVAEITAAHPRGDFKKDFLRTYNDGIKDRPETTYGTMNSDVIEHFDPTFRRPSMVERVLRSAWPT